MVIPQMQTCGSCLSDLVIDGYKWAAWGACPVEVCHAWAWPLPVVPTSMVRLLAGLLSGRFMKTLTTVSPLLFPHPVCHCARLLAFWHRYPSLWALAIPSLLSTALFHSWPLLPTSSGYRSPLLLAARSPPSPPDLPPPVNSWMVRGRCGIRWRRAVVSEIQDGCDLCICGVWMMNFVWLDRICAVVYVWMMDLWLWIWLELFGVIEFLDSLISWVGAGTLAHQADVPAHVWLSLCCTMPRLADEPIGEHGMAH